MRWTGDEKKENIYYAYNLKYKGYHLHFWANSWDVKDKDNKDTLKCFRFLDDAKKYIDDLER